MIWIKIQHSIGIYSRAIYQWTSLSIRNVLFQNSSVCQISSVSYLFILLGPGLWDKKGYNSNWRLIWRGFVLPGPDQGLWVKWHQSWSWERRNTIQPMRPTMMNSRPEFVYITIFYFCLGPSIVLRVSSIGGHLHFKNF